MPLVAALTPALQKEAVALYLSGKSAKQVAEHFSVGLDAVFYTLRKHKVPRRSIQESNRLRYEGKELSYKIKTKLSARDEALKLSAVMLYWAEGYKANGTTVDFANSDADMAKVFIRFLREICGVEESKIRGYLYCYEGQDLQKIRTFWSTVLELPESNFSKPYVKKGASGPRGPRMPNGLVHVRYCDKKLLRQVLTWIDEYRATL